MKLTYVELMEANNLDESGLSAKAKTGIKEIRKTLAGIALAEKNGRTVRQDVIDKLELLDEQVHDLIKRDLDEKAAKLKANDEAEKAKAAEAAKAAVAPAKKDDNVEELPKSDPKGVKIDQDLAEALKNGKSRVSLSELKSISKTAYDIIFDSYEPDGQNGVETSHYSVIETEKEVFTISKL